MTTHGSHKNIGRLLLAFLLSANAYAVTDISTTPLATYVAATSTDVKPNLMYILDDSGSMDWNYMPDWANDNSPPEYLSKNNAFNGVAYSPAVTYSPPVSSYTQNADLSYNVIYYPSMDGSSTTHGADASTKPNWKSVPNDGFGIQSTSSSNLAGNAYYWVSVAGEYCDAPSMKTCQVGSSSTYIYPAKLRWCNSSALTSCQAVWSSTYNKWRTPSPYASTISVSGANATQVSSIKVNGLEILSATTSSSSTNSTVASRIVTNINSCTGGVTGNCTALGYSATIDPNNSNNVIILAPTANTYTPVITKTSTATLTPTAFTAGAVQGSNTITVITSAVTSYPKASTRTDCAGTTCTYNEEMTNYANWWAYYHTRMQMMKSGSGRAFSALSDRFRVGYMSIHYNTDDNPENLTASFLNIKDFNLAQRNAWNTKLNSAKPKSGTPLRRALSDAGRLYAGKLNGTTFNGVTVIDPIQYSCQQNYTILSTDGFWNGNAGYQLDGSTAVGNQDGVMARPYTDGATASTQKRTSTLQQRTTGQLQKQISQLQQQNVNMRCDDIARKCGIPPADGLPGYGTGCTNSSGSPRDCSNYSSWYVVSSSCTTNSSRQCGTVSATVTTVTSPWTNVTSCTATTVPDSNGYTTQCQTAGASPWTPASSCTATATTECQYTSWSSWSSASSCIAVAQSTAPNYIGPAIECQSTASGGTSNTLADVAAYYYNTDLRTSTLSNCTGPIIAPATTPSDLCANNVKPNGLDVGSNQHMTTFTLGLGAPGSMLFSPSYWTDKSGDFYDVWQGNSANTSTGVCAWQANGTQCNWPTPAADSVNNIDDLWHAAINGRGDYFSATSPDTLATSLSDMLKKIVNTPLPGTAAAAASSNPNISSTDNYVFSSSYVSVDWYGELIRQQIDPTTGTLTAPQWSAMTMLDCAMAPAWIASHTYAPGDTFTNSSSCYVVATAYSSGATFNATVGSVSNVDATNSTLITMTTLPVGRTIYTKGASGLIAFNWASLSAAQKAYFSTPYISGLSQFCTSGASCLSSGDQALAEGANLVAFLGGSRTNEGTYYRQRKHILGDIVSSEARYVQTPLFSYNDSGYSAFKTLKASRSGTVYVAANDGMLHAFNATTGAEIWAYIPSIVLPNIYALADKNYNSNHQFFVDNSPEVGDICPSAPSSTCSDTQWKTILVGGLNRGGKGYYALDITDPANPTTLWEFTDATLGYTYGNPRITKLSDGTWVVLVTSGYNNADGVGRLYVLNASTGALISTIGSGGIISTTGSPTPGTAANPSGLARISAHVRYPATDNTVNQVYGGDLNGDLWRFDVNNDTGRAGYDAQLLISFKDASGNAQPITAKPVVTSVNNVPVVYVGTGRYLGTTDVGSTTSQSFYAVVDRLGSTSSGALYGDPRTPSNGFIQQILTSTTCPANSSFCTPGQTTRTIANPASVNLSSDNGWFIDFLTAGERSSTDPALGLGSLVFTTITPQTTSASACGAASTDATSSFVYALNYLTGASVTGAEGVGGVSLGNGIATRPVLVKLPNGTVKMLIRVSGSGSNIPDSTAGGSGTGAATGTDESTVVITPPIDTTNTGQTRRVSWRELITE